MGGPKGVFKSRGAGRLHFEGPDKGLSIVRIDGRSDGESGIFRRIPGTEGRIDLSARPGRGNALANGRYFGDPLVKLGDMRDEAFGTPLMAGDDGLFREVSSEDLAARFEAGDFVLMVPNADGARFELVGREDSGRVVYRPVNKAVFDAWSRQQMAAAEPFLGRDDSPISVEFDADPTQTMPNWLLNVQNDHAVDLDATVVMGASQLNPLLAAVRGADNVFPLTNIKPVTRLTNYLRAAKAGLGTIQFYETRSPRRAPVSLLSTDLIRLPGGDTMIAPRGVARFVSIDATKQQVLDAEKSGEGLEDLPVVVDTSIAGVTSPHLRVVDHHGAFLRKENGRSQKANATMQMVNNFEAALRRAGADIHHPTDAQVDEAIEILNIKQVTTDNLADGAWSVWMAKHQREVLSNPALRKMIRQATYFEDFTAFGNKYDRNDPAVRLQASLFYEYGKILKANGIVGSDRFPPDKAEKVMAEALDAIDRMMKDPAARTDASEKFWANVDAAREKAKGAVMLEAKSGDKTVVRFFDMTKLGDFTVFEQWLAVPEIDRATPTENKLPVQVTVAPMPPASNGSPRLLPIVAVPNGLKLAPKEGLLAILGELNRLEKQKAESLGLPFDDKNPVWFGKENVVLPKPFLGGTLLTPQEIADVVTNPKFGLFEGK